MLTPEQIGIFENKITEAIDQYLATGGKLIAGSFGTFDHNDQKMCMCPISCLIGMGFLGFKNRISRKMGFQFTESNMWDFVDGFDHRKWCPESMNERLYQLGKKLREKYLPAQPRV